MLTVSHTHTHAQSLTQITLRPHADIQLGLDDMAKIYITIYFLISVDMI